jgi:putative NADH-flavin reductase
VSRRGLDRLPSGLVIERLGRSEISAKDYAIAIADLLERDTAHRERVSVAW